MKMSIKDIAQAKVSYGCRRIHVLLLRESWKTNHKRVYRLYKLEGLTMRSNRPERHVSACRRMIRAALPLEDAREKVEEWGQHYNREKPHGSLGNLSPVEFAGVIV